MREAEIPLESTHHLFQHGRASCELTLCFTAPEQLCGVSAPYGLNRVPWLIIFALSSLDDIDYMDKYRVQRLYLTPPSFFPS